MNITNLNTVCNDDYLNILVPLFYYLLSVSEPLNHNLRNKTSVVTKHTTLHSNTYMIVSTLVLKGC